MIEVAFNSDSANGIFHGIHTYDRWKTRATTGFSRIVYNRVGVGRIWHWLVPAGIKTQQAHLTNNFTPFPSGNIWHWQASVSSYCHSSMV
jgi:hypothetical protein